MALRVSSEPEAGTSFSRAIGEDEEVQVELGGADFDLEARVRGRRSLRRYWGSSCCGVGRKVSS